SPCGSCHLEPERHEKTAWTGRTIGLTSKSCSGPQRTTFRAMRGLIDSTGSGDRIPSDEALESPPAMEPVVLVRSGHRRSECVRQRDFRRVRGPRRAGINLFLAAILVGGAWPAGAKAQRLAGSSRASAEPRQPIAVRQRNGDPRRAEVKTVASNSL